METEEKKDYISTLNLPKTDFPMRGNLPQNEPGILDSIFENGLYKMMLEKNKGNKSFLLHDGPPYANGPIHIGHALNKILKDTIVRYKTLNGYYCQFVPGFDTHGLPTEIKAIEKLKLNKDAIDINTFRDTCKEFNKEFIKLQTDGFKRLGVLGDWENPYITYQPQVEEKQLEVFGKMYEKGYIYKGLKPVYWCPSCQTALAEAEIEYKDHKSTSAYVKFEIVDAKGKFTTSVPTYAVIWTTTPWTLPGNMAIVIGPEYKYSLVEVKRDLKDEEGNVTDSVVERYIMLDSLVYSLTSLWGISEYEVIETFDAPELEGIEYKHPFLDRVSRVCLGSDDTVKVETTTGTGIVHCAPGYGREDYLLSLKDHIDILVAVDEKGMQTKEAGMFAGQSYKESNKSILEYLAKEGYLLKTQRIEHSYPHCWRCKNPIIYRAADQWFASVEGFRQDALEAIKNVKWYPAWGEERIYKMVAERNDWCISRQRTWGVPLPIFYCKDCKKEYVTKESIAKICEIVGKEGTNAWYKYSEKELMPTDAKCECGCTEFEKEKDIMDVWFDSGCTHESVVAQRNMGPIDLYLEGNDQYRGWFQSSLLTSVAINGKAPYKEVVTNGFLVDDKGRKMSKSLGNVIDPNKVAQTYGADILRLWVISSDYQNDVSVSDAIIKQVAEIYRKIRNTSRYILGNISDFDPKKDLVAFEDMNLIDKWAVIKTNELVKTVQDAYDKYTFNKAYLAINNFLVNYMSSFYLDIIKDRLYTEKKDGQKRRSSQSAMYEILSRFVRILAPIVSYTAEEIWRYMPKKEGENDFSIMLNDFIPYDPTLVDENATKVMDFMQNVRSMSDKELELKRQEGVIGQALEAQILVKVKNKEDFDTLTQYQELLKEVTITSQVHVELDDSIDEDIQVIAKRADGKKCQRCWVYDVSVETSEDEICQRCQKVLEG